MENLVLLVDFDYSGFEITQSLFYCIARGQGISHCV